MEPWAKGCKLHFQLAVAPCDFEEQCPAKNSPPAPEGSRQPALLRDKTKLSHRLLKFLPKPPQKAFLNAKKA